jgi:hypothetical protein
LFWFNKQDSSIHRTESLDDRILPLVLTCAIQINISSPSREHLSPKAAGDTRSRYHETPAAVFRQVLLQHHDQCFRFLEGDAAGHQAGNRDPVAHRRLQVVLETEKQIGTWPAKDLTSSNHLVRQMANDNGQKD